MANIAIFSYPGCIAFEGYRCIPGYEDYNCCPGFAYVENSNGPPTCKQSEDAINNVQNTKLLTLDDEDDDGDECIPPFIPVAGQICGHREPDAKSCFPEFFACQEIEGYLKGSGLYGRLAKMASREQVMKTVSCLVSSAEEV
jgi:hypothetical protein